MAQPQIPEPVIVRGGTVFDGAGSAPRVADVLVQDGRVLRIAPRLHAVPGAREISAQGQWVLPGFVDTHTHYDAELALAPGLDESVRHGVTTVVVGCCSVSFVASDPEDCADMFTRVESVPREVVLPLLRQLKTWNTPEGWTSWVQRQALGPNVAGFLGHSDLRVRVLGLDRATRTDTRPSEDELRQMEALLEQALDAGMLGLSGMTNPWDKLDGDRKWSVPLPSTFARWKEHGRLEAVLRRRGAILQTAPNLVTRLNALAMVMASGGRWRRPLRTTIIAMMDLKADPWVIGLARSLAFLGNQILGGNFRLQSPPVPFDLYFDGMDSILFEEFPTGQMIRDLARDPEARRRTMKDPEYRAQLHKELHKRLAPKVWHRDLDDATILDAPDPALVGKSFAQIARERGADPIDTFLDLIAEHDRALRWHTCPANHRPDMVAWLMNYPDTLMSFADSGAHLRNMSFYNFSVRMLKQVRDAERAGKPIMPLEKAVWRLTGELADWFGLDAGHLREGDRADLVVLDPERLDASVDAVAFAPYPQIPSLQRLVHRGEAVRWVLINGHLRVEDGLLSQKPQRSGQYLSGARTE